MEDPSEGWDAVAQTFAAIRSDAGRAVVKRWAAHLPPRGSIVDIGCGTGLPIARTLADAGFAVSGIDPSPRLLAAFRANLPGAQTACEAAQHSSLFGRRFDGAVAIGLLFLLPQDTQRIVIGRIGEALGPGGHLLFSAPRLACSWTDTLTDRPSMSPGEDRYRAMLDEGGLRLIGIDRDEGGNDYFHAVRPGAARKP